MNFVEDHHWLRASAIEQLRLTRHVLDDRQVAINVVDPGLAELVCERGLARTPDAAAPDNRRFLPRGFDSAEPKRTVNHVGAACVWPAYL
jgi:hypothetical protein